MTCAQVRELADSFLSGQLLVETNHDIVRHLETCPACREEISARRLLRTRLQEAFDRSAALAPRPDFAADVSDRLRRRETGVSRRTMLKAGWGMAATLAAGAAGALAIRYRASQAALAELAVQAAGDHQNCAVRFNLAERPVSLEEAEQRYGAPYGQLASFEPSSFSSGLRVLARHACVYHGRRFGHIVMQEEDDVVSLLVTRGPAPGAVALHGGPPPLRVASFPVGEYAGFIVAALEEAEISRLAEALAAPLSRHLRA